MLLIFLGWFGFSLIKKNYLSEPRYNPLASTNKEQGSARWMTMAKARKTLSDGGIILGEAYRVDQDTRYARLSFDPANPRTWGRGGKAPLLRTKGNEAAGHGLYFAGAGGFKTVAFAVPSALEWPGALVCFDPSIEIGPLVHADRKRRGHKVIALNPDHADKCGFNVLSFIKANRANTDERIQAVATWLMGTPPESDTARFFFEAATNLINVFLSDVIYDQHLNDFEKNLRLFRQRLSMPQEEVVKALAEIHINSPSSVAADLAGTLKDLVPETFSGVYGNATTATAWLANESLCGLVSSENWSSDELSQGKIDVFINISLPTIHAYPAVCKLIMGSLVYTMIDANGTHKSDALFLIDEAYQLGKNFSPFEIGRDAGRKYGLRLTLIFQSFGQLLAAYGREGAAAWIDSTAWQVYTCISDPDTSERISNLCGTYTFQQRSTSRSSGSSGGDMFGSSNRSTSFSYASAPLIRPEEVRKMRRDECLIFVAGQPPIRCGRAIYFRRPELLARVAANRFAKAKI
jgi:type IV secretion system protein VirD4